MSIFKSDIFILRLKELLNKDDRPKGAFHRSVVSAGQITTWKKRGSAPQADKLLAIAQYFNVTIDYLVGLSDESTPHKTLITYSAEEKQKTLLVKSPEAQPYYSHNHETQEMFGQVQRIINQRGPRDINKMKLFLSTLDPGEEESE